MAPKAKDKKGGKSAKKVTSVKASAGADREPKSMTFEEREEVRQRLRNTAVALVSSISGTTSTQNIYRAGGWLYSSVGGKTCAGHQRAPGHLHRGHKHSDWKARNS